jgi:DNA-binding NarL/FixJ family response regulator
MTSPPDKSAEVKNILIVEDHPIFRMGLADLIEHEDDFAVCGFAEDVTSARSALATLTPDLLILDLALKSSSGMDLLREITADYSKLPVLVLSMHDEEVYAERCLHAGARGYINKKEASESVITAIRHIFAGNVFLSQKMTVTILNKFQQGPGGITDSPLKSLTARELEVFQLIGKGMAPAAIAKRLYLSPKTIYAHTERIKDKLGIAHSSELVRYAALWVESESL